MGPFLTPAQSALSKIKQFHPTPYADHLHIPEMGYRCLRKTYPIISRALPKINFIEKRKFIH